MHIHPADSAHFFYPSNVLPSGTPLADGAYTLVEPLGQGGFGITYLALDVRNQRHAAIKEFFPSGCSRQDRDVCPVGAWTRATYEAARTRFLREAETLRQFDNPGIVRVLDTFQENRTAYMVMECVEGQSLRAMLHERHALPQSEALEYTLQVCAALRVLHAARVLHLDVKPDNIIIDYQGRAVLIDFGAARGWTIGQTASPTVVVTPGYAPLEQYDEAAERGPFTDIYALAATLYHLLTGVVPASATGRAAGVPLIPPRELNPDVSEVLERALMQAMALDRKKRPASAREFVRLLTGAAPPAVSGPSDPTTGASLPPADAVAYVPQQANLPSLPLRYHPLVLTWIPRMLLISGFLLVGFLVYYFADLSPAEVIDLSNSLSATTTHSAARKGAHQSALNVADGNNRNRETDPNHRSIETGSPSPEGSPNLAKSIHDESLKRSLEHSLEAVSAADVDSVKRNLLPEKEELLGDDIGGWRRGGIGSIKTKYTIEATGSSTIPYVGLVTIRSEQPITETFPTAAAAASAKFSHEESAVDTITYSYQDGKWQWQSSAE